MSTHFREGDYIQVTTKDGKIVNGWAKEDLKITGYAQYFVRTRVGDRTFNINFDKATVLVPGGLDADEAQEQIHRLRQALRATGLPEHFIDAIQAGA